MTYDNQGPPSLAQVENRRADLLQGRPFQLIRVSQDTEINIYDLLNALFLAVHVVQHLKCVLLFFLLNFFQHFGRSR